jgi:G3E family GTPase
MDRRGAFDYILLETTGLADPGNIAPLFWVDEGLGSSIYLDGIVTLVDAKNILRSLDEDPPPEEPEISDGTEHGKTGHLGPHFTTAHLQLSHADTIVLNKTDLVTPTELSKVQERIRSINSLAKLHVTSYSQVPQLEGVLLDLHAYDSVGKEELDFASKGHSHLDPAISTITLSLPSLSNTQLDDLDAWLRSVLWENTLPRSANDAGTNTASETWEVHRLKGRVPLTDGKVKILQGVREVFEIFDQRERSLKESRTGTSKERPEALGKLVLIGRHLDENGFRTSLKYGLHLSE